MEMGLDNKPIRFRDFVISNLTMVIEQNKATHDRLDKQNGSIKTLFAKTDELNQGLAEHPIVCPVRVKVEELEKAELLRQGSKATNKQWMKYLWPIIWVAGGALMSLLLGHASWFLPKR